ncbi:MAG: hypothetical protein JST16_04175 [Bdellovibrionales bacterium]|nr:hypothetical protein [Bdellovibrionales bacterium]
MFLKDKTEYKGKMDEETRNTIHKASQAAMMIGGGVGTVGHHGVAGGALGSAGGVGYMMTNDRDYQSEVLFKCK